MSVRVVFVCTGNLARSPYAELVTRGWAQRRGESVEVSSCGTEAQVGAGFDPAMAAHLPVWVTDDWRDFAPRQAGPETLAGADLVLVAQRHHLEWVLDQGPSPLALTLGQYARAVDDAPDGVVGAELLDLVRRRRPAPRPSDDVVDPYRCGAAAAARAAAHLDELLDRSLPATFGWSVEPVGGAGLHRRLL